MINRRRVVVIDDNIDLNKMCCHLVDGMSGFRLIRSYQDINDALSRKELDRPDLIVMGFDSTDHDQINFVPRLCKKRQVEVVVVADFLKGDLLSSAINYGVTGFLLRTSPLAEIEEAIRIVFSDGGFVNAKIARKLIDSCRKNTATVLTRRELEVIHHLSNGKTYTMIADDLEIADGTAKIHIKNVYRKLQASSKAEAIAKARDIQLLS